MLDAKDEKVLLDITKFMQPADRVVHTTVDYCLDNENLDELASLGDVSLVPRAREHVSVNERSYVVTRVEWGIYTENQMVRPGIHQFATVFLKPYRFPRAKPAKSKKGKTIAR